MKAFLDGKTHQVLYSACRDNPTLAKVAPLPLEETVRAFRINELLMV